MKIDKFMPYLGYLGLGSIGAGVLKGIEGYAGNNLRDISYGLILVLSGTAILIADLNLSMVYNNNIKKDFNEIQRDAKVLQDDFKKIGDDFKSIEDKLV